MRSIKSCTDAALLAALNEEVQQKHHRMHPGIFKPYDREGIEAEISRYLSQDGAMAFIAWDDQLPAGYLIALERHTRESAYKYASDSLYIDQISVLSSHRGQGIAKALLAYVLDICREKRIGRIELDHWSANEEARRFFSKAGFTYCKETMFLDLWHRI